MVKKSRKLANMTIQSYIIPRKYKIKEIYKFPQVVIACRLWYDNKEYSYIINAI